MPQFKLTPLTVAMFGAFVTLPTLANGVAQLDEVVVSESRMGTKEKSNVVTNQLKDESVETDLRGLFKSEPSISIGGGNGTSQYLYIRNMGQNSIDVKVDGAYSDSQIHYHQGRHMLDPALVKVVSVQKGAGSASAGIGQTNGAIIAKTLDAQDLLQNSSNPNFGARVNAGYNSNDGHNYGLALFGKNELVDALLVGNRVDEDNYRGGKGYTNGANGSNRVPYSALDKTSYLAKLGLNLDNHRFVLSHLKEQHDGIRTVREEFAVDDAPGSRLTTERQAPTKRKMSVTNTNLEWTAKDLPFAEALSANAYRLVQGRWSADDKGNGYAGGKLNSGSTRTEIVTYGANLNLDSRVHDKVLVKYGLNYRDQEAKPNQIFLAGISNQEKRDVGAYVEVLTEIKDVLLTTGVRYDHFNFKAMDGKKVSDGAVNPSVGLIWDVNSDFSLSASHNYATRSPRMHDAIMSHGGRSVVSIADNTKAEKARNTEIGFNYRNGAFGLDGSYFWQSIHNALGTSTARDNHLCPTGGRSRECYSEIINAGKVKNSGYELNASYHQGGWLARVGVAESKPTFYGERLSANPEYAMRIGRTWTGSLAYRFNQPNLEIGVNHRYVEKVKKEDASIMANAVITPASKDRPAYHITDLTANWKPLGTDKMNVNFAINNIANKNYVSQAQRGDSLVGAGREYRVGVNYTF
ncbi:TonB-dependent siderophore receptor [Pasteurellaceae bacterium Macca]|nr:TonB-dependent siderophore receptor [Pasteurellaceae bacterium Macca]